MKYLLFTKGSQNLTIFKPSKTDYDTAELFSLFPEGQFFPEYLGHTPTAGWLGRPDQQSRNLIG